jgi:hypothetical protein
VRRPLTPGQRRKILDATEPPEFTPATRPETLRDRMDLGTFTPVGWTPPPSQLSYDGWVRTGTTILILERATPWLWGDWWLARDSRVLPDDWVGPDQRTLDNYATVSRSYPIHARRETVSFKHHAELTALDEKERNDLLDWCASPQRPSVAELRLEKRQRELVKLPPAKPAPQIKLPKGEPPTPLKVLRVEPLVVEPPADDITLPVTLFLSAELNAQATAAADNEDIPLTTWIVGLIEQACAL